MTAKTDSEKVRLVGYVTAKDAIRALVNEYGMPCVMLALSATAYDVGQHSLGVEIARLRHAAQV